jgi:peptide-methionine (S)-S-oxide reductase
VAVFSGGCFWGVQAVFEHVNGVVSAESGYTGGANGTADYETVSGGDTGHAESVRVVYDPARVSYAQLLDVFFTVVHDPTQLNRQGPDHGTQYRSAIWYTTPAQQQAAQQFIARLGKSGTFKQPIVTTVKPLGGFYPAESYHQDYYVKHPESAYIIYNDVPKVKALKRQFPALWRDEPVLMAASRKS